MPSLTRRRASGLVAAGLAIALGTSACSSSAATTTEPSTATYAIKSCQQVQCEGTLDGARYHLLLPASWNGTLLIWSHGYRNAQPWPPDASAPVTTAEAFPGDTGSGDGGSEGAAVRDTLLRQGYALIGSSFATNGWAVNDGVQAAEKIHSWFASTVAQPRRVYVWGASLGGLVTQMISEKDRSWVSGAAPLCGVVGGLQDNLDGGLALEFAVKQLLYPQMKMVGYASFDEALADFQGAYQAVIGATKDVTNGVPKLVAVAAMIGSPQKTKTYDASTAESLVGAYAESIITQLTFATLARYEVEQRAGGNVSDITNVDYAGLATPDVTALVAAVGGDARSYVATVNAGTRPPVDAAARAKARDLGNPTGTFDHPTLTLHTQYDPLVLVQNESLLRQEALKTGSATWLAQYATKPPATYTSAPYGAGHCNFTPTEFTGTVDLLNTWVRDHQYPLQHQAQAAIAQPTGLDVVYVAPPWPATIN